MKYEVALLERLGFEVFIPKVIPSTGFRSGAVDHSFDKGLSIGRAELEELNAFDFYTTPWTPRIIAIVNRYFNMAFTMPYGTLLRETIDHFEGTILLRAFGLQVPWTYEALLEQLHGGRVLRKIQGIRHRFFFAEGYDNLHEVEPPVLQERRLFLPIGMPSEYFQKATKWVGGLGKVMLLCPNIANSDYYGKVYADFKRDFGDLPHLIIGVQEIPVDDEAVVGFVSDERMMELFATCAALYYPSDEPRHVHYSPIEAAIAGLPVVFHSGSLLDRMSGGKLVGRVSSKDEARALLTALLDPAPAFIDEVHHAQATLPDLFSDKHCFEVWNQNLTAVGLLPIRKSTSVVQTLFRELKRTAMMGTAHGRLEVDPHRQSMIYPSAEMTSDESTERLGESLFEGIDFTREALGPFIFFVDGLGHAEEAGRWSAEATVSVVLRHSLSGKVRLFLRTFGFEKNIGAEATLRVGSVRSSFMVPAVGEDTAGSWISLELPVPTNVIEIDVPHLYYMKDEGRSIGIALCEMRAFAPVRSTADEALARYGSNLFEGIRFNESPPAFVDGYRGLGFSDGNGRWSVARQVAIELRHVLEGEIVLYFQASALGSNIDADLVVSVGSASGKLRLDGSTASVEREVRLNVVRPSNTITIDIPSTHSSVEDARALGIHLVSLRAESVETANA